MVKVVELTREVLRECGVDQMNLVVYRVFTMQLIKLVSKGHVTIRVRTPVASLPKEYVDKLEQVGVKWHYVIDEGGDELGRWSLIRDVDKLKRFYILFYRLREDVLNRIIEKINKCDILVMP